MGQGHAAQYVAGTMPVAVPHRPDSANVREENFVGELARIVHFQGHEVGLVIHAVDGEHDANDMQAEPEGLRFIVPHQFNEYGLADVAKGIGRIQGQAVAIHGCNPPL